MKPITINEQIYDRLFNNDNIRLAKDALNSFKNSDISKIANPRIKIEPIHDKLAELPYYIEFFNYRETIKIHTIVTKIHLDKNFNYSLIIYVGFKINGILYNISFDFPANELFTIGVPKTYKEHLNFTKLLAI